MSRSDAGPGPDRPGLIAVFGAQAREARVVLVLSWAALGSIIISSLTQAHTGAAPSTFAQAISEVLGLALLIRFQIASCRGGAAHRVDWVPPLLIAVAVLPIPWGALPFSLVLAVAVVALHYPARLAVPICGGLAVLMVLTLPPAAGVGIVGLLLELTMLVAIVVAVSVLAVRLDRLHFTREVLARRRVDVERDRVARDLHDLMGRTLVAASLRNQTALRVLRPGHPETAALLEQIHETLSVGQVQLRALTNGPTIAGLEAELDSARTLCQRVNIDLTIDLQDEPPGPVEFLVGLVIRENITNVLKHSRASWCAVKISVLGDAVVITVTNDGVTPQTGAAAAVDTRLARAVSASGGETAQGVNASGDFEFSARIPVPVPARSRAVTP